MALLQSSNLCDWLHCIFHIIPPSRLKCCGLRHKHSFHFNQRNTIGEHTPRKNQHKLYVYIYMYVYNTVSVHGNIAENWSTWLSWFESELFFHHRLSRDVLVSSWLEQKQETDRERERERNCSRKENGCLSSRSSHHNVCFLSTLESCIMQETDSYAVQTSNSIAVA